MMCLICIYLSDTKISETGYSLPRDQENYGKPFTLHQYIIIKDLE